MKRTALALMMALIFSFLFCGILVQHVESQSFEAIFIKADGNLEGTNKIQRVGNIYMFTSNIEAAIVIEASNIVLDGAGFTLQGEITINGNNVEIKDLKIFAPDIAIEIYGSGCSIIENNVQQRYL